MLCLLAGIHSISYYNDCPANNTEKCKKRKEKKEVKCVLKPDQIADPVFCIATETVVSPSDRAGL